MRDRFPAKASIDLSQCDNIALRKLVTHVFLEAVTEADLTSQWAQMISGSRNCPTLASYTTAIKYLETHTSLTRFLRCPAGTELLEWLGGYSEGLHPDGYWEVLEDKLSRARFGISPAKHIINRGPPKA